MNYAAGPAFFFNPSNVLRSRYWPWAIFFVTWFFYLRERSAQLSPTGDPRLRRLSKMTRWLWFAVAGAVLWIVVGKQSGGPLIWFALLCAVVTLAVGAASGAGALRIATGTLLVGAATFRSALHIARSIPVMLVVVAFVFITQDAWRLLGNMSWFRTTMVLLLLAAAILLKLIRMAQTEMGDADRAMDSWARLNLYVVFVGAVLLRVFVSVLVLSGTLIFFGLIAISRSEAVQLTGTPAVGHDGLAVIIGNANSGTEVFFLSSALVKVSTVLSFVAGLFFVTVTVPTDKNLRAELWNEERRRFKRAVQRWISYRATVGGTLATDYSLPQETSRPLRSDLTLQESDPAGSDALEPHD